MESATILTPLALALAVYSAFRQNPIFLKDQHNIDVCVVNKLANGVDLDQMDSQEAS